MADKYTDLGDESITCPSCGARMKSDRAHCLRCFETLQIDEPERPARRTFDIPGGLGVKLGAVAGVAVVAFIGFVWTDGTSISLAHPSPSPVHVVNLPPATPVAAGFAPGFASDAAAPDDFSAAKGAFEQRLKLDPTNEAALIGLGGVLERTGALTEAVNVFHRAAAAAPDSATPRLRAAAIESRLGRQTAAIADYRAALRLVPDDYTTHAALASTLEAAGDIQDAVDQFDIAARLAPDADEAARVSARRDGLASGRR